MLSATTPSEARIRAARQILRRRMFEINAVGDLERWNRRARLRRAQAEYRAMIADRNDEVEWDDFRQFMQRTFGPQNPLQHYTRALVANRQGKQESVSSYSSRFRNVLLKLQTIDRDAYSAAAIVLWYTEGLGSELQAELERDASETLEEAVKSPEKQNEFGSGSKKTAEPPVIAALNTGTPDARPRPVGPCFYCKKPGHRIADCPKRLATGGAVGGGFAKHANSAFPMNAPYAPAPYGVPMYPMPMTGAPSQPVFICQLDNIQLHQLHFRLAKGCLWPSARLPALSWVPRHLPRCQAV